MRGFLYASEPWPRWQDEESLALLPIAFLAHFGSPAPRDLHFFFSPLFEARLAKIFSGYALMVQECLAED